MPVCSQDSARLGTPDCPMVHRTVSGAPGQLRRTGHSREKSAAYGCNSPDCSVSQRSPAPTVGRTIFARHVDCSNGQLVHRTVRCAPDSVRCANRPRCNGRLCQKRKEICTGSSTVTIRWRTGLSGAPPDRRQEWPSLLVSNGS